MNFSDYAKLTLDVKRVAKSLGFELKIEEIESDRRVELNKDLLDLVLQLQQETTLLLEKILLDSEIAKREFLIAPIFKILLLNFDYQLSVEYQIDAGDKLKGKLDYLLRKNKDILVVEAKKDDFDGGGKQLIAELVAMSIVEKSNIVHGAVTNGRIWQFYRLDRHPKTIYQDTKVYRFPEDTAQIFNKLI